MIEGSYKKTIKEGYATLTVRKYRGRDGGSVDIIMQIHDDLTPVEISLRNEQAFEDLYYMLTQVRGENEKK